MKFYSKSLIPLGLLAMSPLAMAGSTLPSETRALGMGGTGVASANSVASGFYNPAMLSMQPESADFAILFPYVGVSAIADDELIDEIDEIQDEEIFDRFEEAVDDYNDVNDGGTPQEISAALDNVIDRADDLNDALASLDGSAVKADVGVGLAIALPGEDLGFSFFSQARATAGVLLNYEDEDSLGAYIEQAEAIQQGASADDLDDVDSSLNSNARLVAVGVSEVGLAFSRNFDFGWSSPIAIGITPKYMTIATYDYVEEIEDFDDDDSEDDKYETDDSGFGLDLGFATYLDADRKWRVGLALRDLVSPDAETVGGLKVEIDPRATVGLNYQSDWFSWATDLELTKNNQMGFESETQFISTGVEFDLIDLVQLRMGLRANISGDNAAADSLESDALATFGVGFSPFGLHVDISAMAGDEEVGAAIEFAFDI